MFTRCTTLKKTPWHMEIKELKKRYVRQVASNKKLVRNNNITPQRILKKTH